MSFANRFNKGKKFNFNTEGLEFSTLKEEFEKNGEEHVYTLKSIFINTKSKYGHHPIFATETFLVGCPQHMLETANEILNDNEAINAINNNKVGFTIYLYKAEKFDTDAYGIKFVDLI